jgi:UDP:flavonoid glycosyltransferase YjiC (YdhE family)
VNFLISTMPASGHVNPALPVAAELVRRDHEVWWHTGRGYVFAKQAGEGLLDHVLRLGDRAQHAGGHTQRVAAVLLPGRTHRGAFPLAPMSLLWWRQTTTTNEPPAT